MKIKKDRILSECYPNWNECIELSTDPYNMQCLSCKEGFNLYSKSHNCLKCPHYINYEQIECIDSIPDGYYLEIESLGILDKCEFTTTLARGLSIYTGIVFEFYDREKRITSAIGGGGRYDKIITNFMDNGNSYPAIGLSFGLEPIFVILKQMILLKS